MIQKKSKPLITIITTSYNKFQFLNDAFESIFNQTYENIELLILDDCSTDKSVEKIESWIPKLESKLAKVVFTKHKKNIGCIKSVNEMIRQSTGEYIMFCDGDDVLVENCAEVAVDFLENHKEYLLCYANLYVIDEKFEYSDRKKGNIIKNKYFFNNYIPLKGKIFFDWLMLGNNIVTSTVFYRKQCFEKYGLYNENLYAMDDYEHCLRVAQKEIFPYINQCLVYLRIVSNSISHNKKPELVKKRLVSREKILLMYLQHFKNIEKINKILKSHYKQCIYESFDTGYDSKINYYISKIGWTSFIKEIYLDIQFRRIFVKYIFNKILSIVHSRKLSTKIY